MVLFAGCYNSPAGKYSNNLTFAPTPTLDSQIVFPSTLPIIVIPGNACQTAQEIAVATSFDIVVIPSPQTDVFMDSVTLRLINGESVGGPSVTFPTPDLNRMFGPTVVVGRRAFTFRTAVWLSGGQASIDRCRRRSERRQRPLAVSGGQRRLSNSRDPDGVP